MSCGVVVVAVVGIRPLPVLHDAPHCTVNSSATAFVLPPAASRQPVRLFHDYTDVLIPAFITAHRSAGEAQFLLSDFNSWWVPADLPAAARSSRHLKELLDFIQFFLVILFYIIAIHQILYGLINEAQAGACSPPLADLLLVSVSASRLNY
jgi:hypothetical protein